MMFDEIIGQDRAKRIITNRLDRPFIQNFIFTGPSGTGKRTTAILLARNINCKEGNGCGTCRNCRRAGKLNFPDLHLLVPISGKEMSPDHLEGYALGEVAPSLRQNEIITIDHVREIIVESQRPPIEGKRIVIIVHAHRMRYEAVSALLKVIEEQPNETLFILTTPQLNAIPDTIRSRCQIVRFNYLNDEQVQEILRNNGISTSTIVHGSPGETIRFVTSKFYDVSRKIFLRSPYTKSRYPRIIEELKKRGYDIRELIQNLLYWYHLLLYARLNPLKVSDADIVRKTQRLETLEIVKSIERILKIYQTLDYHPNRRLVIFNLLESLC